MRAIIYLLPLLLFAGCYDSINTPVIGNATAHRLHVLCLLDDGTTSSAWLDSHSAHCKTHFRTSQSSVDELLDAGFYFQNLGRFGAPALQ